MLFIQMTGLSGAGKSTIARIVGNNLIDLNYKVEILDGDECRRNLCSDLSFSKEDRLENIRRLGFVGLMLARHGVITILAAINPYEEARSELKNKSSLTKTVFIDCPLDITKQRDTKGLYYKALLPAGHPEHITHFTGISDPFEIPINPDLIIKTNIETVEQSAQILTDFIVRSINNIASDSHK